MKDKQEPIPQPTLLQIVKRHMEDQQEQLYAQLLQCGCKDAYYCAADLLNERMRVAALANPATPRDIIELLSHNKTAWWKKIKKPQIPEWFKTALLVFAIIIGFACIPFLLSLYFKLLEYAEIIKVVK